MANSISTHDIYLDIIDEVYKQASKTAILDTNEINSKIQKGKTIKVDKISVTGLGNYDRNNGYKKGSVTLTQEEIVPSYDRGIKLEVDVMDDEETQNHAWGKAINELERTQAIPELDAYRLSQYATNAGNSAEADLTATTIVTAIDTASAQMSDDEVYEENRVLFISNEGKQLLKQSAPRRWGNDTVLNRNIETYDEMAVVTVPANRFKTTVTLNPDGGFTPGAQSINFMIVQKDAVIQALKHKVSDIIDASMNQSADAHIMKYRVYGVADVYENKTKGIYLHKKPIE